MIFILSVLATTIGIVLFLILPSIKRDEKLKENKKKIREAEREHQAKVEEIKEVEKKVKELKKKNEDIDTELAKKVKREEITAEEA